jgi:hypothetical protein
VVMPNNALQPSMTKCLVCQTAPRSESCDDGSVSAFAKPRVGEGGNGLKLLGG